MWVYVAGPLIGVAIAVGCAWILRGRGGDPTSRAAGSGVLTSLRHERAKLEQDIEDKIGPGHERTDGKLGLLASRPGAADEKALRPPSAGADDHGRRAT